MNPQVKNKAPFILIVAFAFFIYELYLLANSFGAESLLVEGLLAPALNGNLSALAWLSSELIGEVGVILRFAGACIFLAFTALLLLKKTFSFSLLRKAVLLEGIYYLFNIPFIFYLLMGRSSSTASFDAALSYAGQLLIVTPIFLKLYFTLKKPGFELAQAARWISLAIVAFTFGLWVKHFALAFYALPPFSLSNALFMVGFVNSAATLLAAGLIMIAAFWPVIKKTGSYRRGLFGTSFILMGSYAAVFLAACVLSPYYAAWFDLVDYWIIIMLVLGAGVLLKK